jgi:hypothetical protein
MEIRPETHMIYSIRLKQEEKHAHRRSLLDTNSPNMIKQRRLSSHGTSQFNPALSKAESTPDDASRALTITSWSFSAISFLLLNGCPSADFHRFGIFSFLCTAIPWSHRQSTAASSETREQDLSRRRSIEIVILGDIEIPLVVVVAFHIILMACLSVHVAFRRPC